MFLESVLFPSTIALGMQGGPRFATTVAPSPSGDEALMGHWALELGAWDLVQANRTDTETEALLALFRLACGRAHGFRFHDREDDLAVAQLLGTGDGIETTFQLVKHYTEESLTYTRTILKPVFGTIVVYLDGVVATGYTVPSSSGRVTFAAAPAADVLVTATFRFHVPVRFDMDQCTITMVEPGISTWTGVRLVELTDASGTGTTAESSVSQIDNFLPVFGVRITEAAAPPAGTGFLPTHYGVASLHWIPPHFPIDDPLVSIDIFYQNVPITPNVLVGSVGPTIRSFTFTTFYGDYQGGPSGPTYAPAYTPALDGNIYEESGQRDVGYTFQLYFHSRSGLVDVTEIAAAVHEIHAPSVPQHVTATFVEAGPFFSYVTFTYARPAKLYGSEVYYYFAEYDSGSGWTPLPSVGSTADEFLGTSVDGGATFTGNSGFADRPGTFTIRFKAQNDWGTSGWATSNTVTWT